MCIHSSMMPIARCSACTPVPRNVPVRKAPSRRTPRGVPTWGQWLMYKATRPLAHVPQCILCGWDLSAFVDLLEAEIIRIGCRVKVIETESFTVCNVEYTDITSTKIIPVSLTGLGCPMCRAEYIKAVSAEMGRYQAEDAGYITDLHNPAKRAVLLRYGCTSPNKRQPMIDVEDLVLQMEAKHARQR